MTQKARYGDPRQRRLYPVSTFNSMTARPLSRLLAPLLSPNQVSLLSLLTSLAGFALVWTAHWPSMAAGGLLVHLGLLLDHADGQVARRTGKGSTWGMYLDMVIDRIVEAGLIISLIPAMASITDAPLASWLDVGGHAAWLAAAAVAVMLLWRFLTAYNDVLYLRAHLVDTGRLPHPSATPRGLVKRPLVPWVFNRDWVLLIWLAGVLAGQAGATVLLLLALHVLVCIEKILVFRVRHKRPEGDANRVLGRDYH